MTDGSHAIAEHQTRIRCIVRVTDASNMRLSKGGGKSLGSSPCWLCFVHASTNEMISMLSSRCMRCDWSIYHLLAIMYPKKAVGASRIREIQGPVERLVGKSYDFGSSLEI
jgi:hypothetical protein